MSPIITLNGSICLTLPLINLFLNFYLVLKLNLNDCTVFKYDNSSITKVSTISTPKNAATTWADRKMLWQNAISQRSDLEVQGLNE